LRQRGALLGLRRQYGGKGEGGNAGKSKTHV